MGAQQSFPAIPTDTTTSIDSTRLDSSTRLNSTQLPQYTITTPPKPLQCALQILLQAFPSFSFSALYQHLQSQLYYPIAHPTPARHLYRILTHLPHPSRSHSPKSTFHPTNELPSRPQLTTPSSHLQKMCHLQKLLVRHSP